MYDAIFQLNDDELSLVATKKGKKNKLGFAVLLKYFQLESHYPKDIKFVDPMMLSSLASQLSISASTLKHFNFEGRSTERFRQEIRNYTGHRLATLNDVAELQAWLTKEVFPYVVKGQEQVEYAYTYFSERKIEPFTSRELERYVRSAYRKFEQDFFCSIEHALSDDTKDKMDKLLSEEDPKDYDEESQPGEEIKFRHLKHGIPGAKLKHVERALEKIDCFIQLNLPKPLLSSLSIKLVKKYTMRVMAELPGSMMEYKPTIRYAIFALFCYYRARVLIDDLADLLMQLVHQMELSAEKFIDKKILSEVKRVDGKFDILYQLSSTALNNPTGIIKDTIYPEVSCETLDRLVIELKSRGKWYEKQVQTKIRSLYSHAHRKKLLTLLNAFELKTTLQESQPLLNAIQFVLKHTESTETYYPEDITAMVIDKVIPSKWHDAVIEYEEKIRNNKNKIIKKVNRINYELAVLDEFRKQLNCKMIWIDGALRYRDPNEDLPKDFEKNREFYYHMLGLPLDVQEYITSRRLTFGSPSKRCNSVCA